VIYNTLCIGLLVGALTQRSAVAGEDAGDLPLTDGTLVVPAQPAVAGEARAMALHIRYPGGKLANVKPTTGLMLFLHNWGGTGFGGAPQPDGVIASWDLIGIGVDYYQSGDTNKAIPYDFGYVQSMDALRALWIVAGGLERKKIRFDKTRMYGAGGSGGGNVVQMANKVAPRTFAAIVDLSGMASLTDDIAFHVPGGSGLDARYSRDPASPAYLSPAMQAIRDLGQPDHLKIMKELGNACKIVVVHGADDGSCPAADKRRVVAAMQMAGLDIEPHFITPQDVDGKLFSDSGHALGNRTQLLQHFGERWIAPASATMRRLAGPPDFELGGALRYPVPGGAYVVSFTNGWPEIGFVSGS
jgi:predicted esterase